jgi:anti-sigma factor RsiW
MGQPGFSLPCHDARTLVSQALDGEISEIREAALDAHLRACPECSCFARETGAFTSIVRAAPLEPAPFVTLLREPGRSRRRSTRPLWIGIAAAMALAASLLAGTLLGRETRAPQQNARLSNLVQLRAPVTQSATQQPYLEQQLLAMLARSHSPTGRAIAT